MDDTFGAVARHTKTLIGGREDAEFSVFLTCANMNYQASSCNEQQRVASKRDCIAR